MDLYFSYGKSFEYKNNKNLQIFGLDIYMSIEMNGSWKKQKLLLINWENSHFICINLE